MRLDRHRIRIHERLEHIFAVELMDAIEIGRVTLVERVLMSLGSLLASFRRSQSFLMRLRQRSSSSAESFGPRCHFRDRKS